MSKQGHIYGRVGAYLIEDIHYRRGDVAKALVGFVTLPGGARFPVVGETWGPAFPNEWRFADPAEGILARERVEVRK